MKIERMDIVVPILAGLSCFLMYAGIPVWAVFIGWAWYFALGAKTDVFGRAIPAMLLGCALGGVSIVLCAGLGDRVVAVAAVICVMVFFVMMSVKTKLFACSLASFNGFSCMFVGYYAGAFPAVEPGFSIANVAVATAWIAFSTVIGLGLGYASIKLAAPGGK